jgi:hypothetical protein
MGIRSCFKIRSSSSKQAVAMVTLSETEVLHQVGENGEYKGNNCCYAAVGEETGFI